MKTSDQLKPISPEEEHLQILTPEQAAAYAQFKDWFLSDRRLGVLKGVGGSGKTFSVGQWIKAIGLNIGQYFGPDHKDNQYSEDVMALAPTNKAVESIEKALFKREVFCKCLTIHRSLGWVNQKLQWGRDEETRLLGLLEEKMKKEEEFDYTYIKENLDPRIKLLASIKEAVKKEKLVFSPGSGGIKTEERECLRLVIVDECSMISEEIYNALVVTFDKILFMGDDEQLFPVGEGISKCFESQTIAEFLSVKRSEGSLRDFNYLIRNKDLRTMHSLCTGVEATKEILLEDNQVRTIAKPNVADLVKTWLNSKSWDGSEFRVIYYKNETIENFQVFAKKYMGEDWKEGDLITAHKPLQRWCGSNPEIVALNTDHPSEILSIGEFNRASVVGPNQRQDIKVARAVIDAPGFYGEGYTLSCPKGHAFFSERRREYKQKEWIRSKPKTVVVNLVSFEDFKTYRDLVKNWSKIRSVFYSRASRPANDTEGAQLLFKLLGIGSWTQVPDTPGYKRFLVEDLRSLEQAEFLKFDQIGPPESKKKNYEKDSPVDYYWLQRAVNAYYYWLRGLHDTLRLRISSTVHKAQGQTIENVLMHLPEIYESRLYGPDGIDNARRAIYTAASRTSKQLYILN